VCPLLLTPHSTHAHVHTHTLSLTHAHIQCCRLLVLRSEIINYLCKNCDNVTYVEPFTCTQKFTRFTHVKSHYTSITASVSVHCSASMHADGAHEAHNHTCHCVEVIGTILVSESEENMNAVRLLKAATLSEQDLICTCLNHVCIAHPCTCREANLVPKCIVTCLD
jgi:hypothetical protein